MGRFIRAIGYPMGRLKPTMNRLVDSLIQHCSQPLGRGAVISNQSLNHITGIGSQPFQQQAAAYQGLHDGLKCDIVGDPHLLGVLQH